jgi:hypothetical protein
MGHIRTSFSPAGSRIVPGCDLPDACNEGHIDLHEDCAVRILGVCYLG